MRQRKLKNLNERLDAFSRFIIEDPAAHRGRWKEVFGNDKPIWLEIGCGKGQFITRHAALHPERNYIAVEGHESVVLRALEKAAAMNGTAGTAVDTARASETSGDGTAVDTARASETSGAETAGDAANSAGTPGSAGAEDKAGPGNLCFILEYVRDIRDLFADGELEGVYLNFSDPWPKERHAKRRLTYGKRLRQYAQIIRPGGVIAFKTDNEGLFDFSLEQIQQEGMEILEMSRDLHRSPYSEENITTEYEDKFASTGKNINYVKFRA